MPTIEGKIINAFEPRKGQSARGEWMVQEFLLESNEQPYPRKCLFSIWGAERLQAFNLQVGMYVSVDIDIDAREYNGKYYNSIRAWRVTSVPEPMPAAAPAPQNIAPGVPMPPVGAAPAPAQAPAAAPTASPASAAPASDPFGAPGTEDDLPF